MGSAKKNADKDGLELELSSSDQEQLHFFKAAEWLAGVDGMRKADFAQTGAFLKEANRRLQEGANEDERERIIEECQQLERKYGQRLVGLSSIRVGSLPNQWRRELTGQREPVAEEESCEE